MEEIELSAVKEYGDTVIIKVVHNKMQIKEIELAAVKEYGDAVIIKEFKQPNHWYNNG